MNLTNTYLVNGPESVQFMDMAQLATGGKLYLGDPDHVDVMVKPDVLSAHMEFRIAAGKIVGLVNDPTRTLVDKHHAAKQIAEKLQEKLGKTKNLLTKRAESLEKEAMATADDDLGPKSERAVIQSEIRGWLREQTRSTDGLEKIRKAMAKTDSYDLAATIWNSPSFLTGIPHDTHEELRFEALESHRPDLYAKISNSLALKKMADKYDATMRKIPVAFYNPVIAEQFKKRVEV